MINVEYFLDISKRKRYRIEVSEYNNVLRLDVREQFPDDETDEWHMTRKGINLPVTKADELIALINKAIAEAEGPAPDTKASRSAPRKGSQLERVASKTKRATKKSSR